MKFKSGKFLNNSSRIISSSSRTAIFFICFLIFNTAFATNSSIPELPEPYIMPDAKASWIARQFLHNDTPMSILEFSYPGSLQQVAAHYENHLSGKPALIELKDKHLKITYEENGHIVSVQLISAGNKLSKGKIVTSKPRDFQSRQAKTDLPLISGSTIISKTQSIDGKTSSETLMVTNFHSREANYRYLKQELKKKGWEKGREKITGNSKASHEIFFERGSQNLQITLFPLHKFTNGNTGILIHWLK